jgi:hypothetical protein
MSSAANSTGMKSLTDGKGRRLTLVLLTMFGVALFFLAAPLFVVFLIGMVPTVVAFVCDRDRDKYMAIAIGAGNFAGVVPFLVALAMQGPTLTRAAETVTDIFSIATMFSGAAAGWVIVSILPAVVAVYMNVTTDGRVQRVRRAQHKLVEEWGADVAKTDIKPPDTK